MMTVIGKALSCRKTVSRSGEIVARAGIEDDDHEIAVLIASILVFGEKQFRYRISIIEIGIKVQRVSILYLRIWKVYIIR